MRAGLSFLWVFVCISASGGTLGFLLATMCLQTGWSSRVIRRFSRIGMWVPLLILWPLPVWFHATSENSIKIWTLGIGIISVTVSMVYYYLSIVPIADSIGNRTREHILRKFLVQSLFVSLILHVRVSPVAWFPSPGVTAIPDGYTVLLLIVFVSLVLELKLGSEPDKLSRDGTEIIRHNLKDAPKSDLWYVLFVVGVFLLIWWLISVITPSHHSPTLVEVIAQLMRFILGSPISPGQAFLWQELGVSLLEVALGLASGGAFASLLVCAGAKSAPFRLGLLRVLRSTYVLLMTIPLFVFGRLEFYFGMWLSVAVVASLSIFPFLHGFSSSGDHRWWTKVLLGVEDALPYGFIGMLSSESIHAAYGVGLSMTIASATGQSVDGCAIAAVLTCAFVALAVLVRAILRTTLAGEQEFRRQILN